MRPQGKPEKTSWWFGASLILGCLSQIGDTSREVERHKILSAREGRAWNRAQNDIQLRDGSGILEHMEIHCVEDQL